MCAKMMFVSFPNWIFGYRPRMAELRFGIMYDEKKKLSIPNFAASAGALAAT